MAIYNTFLIFLDMSFFGFIASNTEFPIKETNVHEIQIALKHNKLTSRQLVEFYLTQIESLNPLLRSVIEVNPEALFLADKADRERNAKSLVSQSSLLHGIPILLKDNIATKDKLNTTAGSYALLSSVVARDAGVVAKLRKAGAIILGKASMTEWAAFRSYKLPNGWCARAGQVGVWIISRTSLRPFLPHSSKRCRFDQNHVVLFISFSLSANFVQTLWVLFSTSIEHSNQKKENGKEKQSYQHRLPSFPSNFPPMFGIKIINLSLNNFNGKNPYVKSTDPCGSSTRSAVSVAANMVTLSHGTETAGPIYRTVSDAVYVLDAIVGFDPYDVVATRKALKYIPHDGYVQFLKVDGLRGKRLTSYPFYSFTNNSDISQAFKLHFNTLRQRGAILVDGLDIPNFVAIMNFVLNDQDIALLAEFSLSVNDYLKDLLTSPVRSLADAIAFNKKFLDLVRTTIPFQH
ncbi:hypothetical protein TEA_011677 [Camellia sinensis var. sinensis]|uniref:Amidase domain-containing protein n=1 Tax=Camellia sinensis var. sinensis TaxID=542762 RepID=A0A4S4DWA4_CAMSN|nr:hypothetical protein TEA_011677 [Camellia sinensis var. sinensis]